MSRVIRVALFLMLLAVWTGGCKPKDQIITQIQTPPGEPTGAGNGDFLPKKK